MKTLSFYKYAAGLLLLMNLGVLVFFLGVVPAQRHGGPPGGDRQGGFRAEATAMLNLDAAQEEAFIRSTEQHQDLMNTINEQERDLLKAYFAPLTGTPADMDSAALLDQLALLKKEKISGTYHHFTEVKELLRQDQLTDFAKFIQKALQILLLEEKRPGGEGIPQ